MFRVCSSLLQGVAITVFIESGAHFFCEKTPWIRHEVNIANVARADSYACGANFLFGEVDQPEPAHEVLGSFLLLWLMLHGKNFNTGPRPLEHLGNLRKGRMVIINRA